MFVGVDLDATARKAGPRVNPFAKQEPLFEKPTPMKRSTSFNPPSARLTQPTKSTSRRKDVATERFTGGTFAAAPAGASARGGQSASARSGSNSARGGQSMPFGSGEAKQRPMTPGSTARLSSPGRFAPSSSRARPSAPSQIRMHEKTHSPSGRYHPDPIKRREIRSADITCNIDYYAPHGAPDNDRKMKEASWLCSQAFIESLRNYPDPFRASPIVMPGESVAFDGNTQSARRRHTEHIETATRRRLSIAPSDDDWLPEQCPIRWPDHILEGKWRAVGPIKKEDMRGAIGGGLFNRWLGREPSRGSGPAIKGYRGTPGRFGRSSSADHLDAPNSARATVKVKGDLFSR